MFLPYRWLLAVCLYFLLLPHFCICELFTLTTIGTGALLGYLGYNFDTVKEQTYCRFQECCNKNHIPANVQNLKWDLEKNLFGQHLVIETVVKALRSHYHNLERSSKPLVMSFHGTPGTGKNYVADFIAKAIYKKGVDSNYVHKFVGRIDFPVASRVDDYKVYLRDRVIQAVKKCPQSLFIFDEVDEMPSGVFEAVTSLLDHHHSIHGLNFRKSVFIFLINSGGVEIGHKLQALLSDKSFVREDSKLHHFEKLIATAAFNDEGGMKGSGPISSALIDHYIPFLPLEKRHVEKCIEVEFRRLGISPNEDKMRQMFEFVTFRNGFSENGCKRLSKKADIFLRF